MGGSESVGGILASFEREERFQGRQPDAIGNADRFFQERRFFA